MSQRWCRVGTCILVSLVVTTMGCRIEPPGESEYLAKITAARELRDRAYASASPPVSMTEDAKAKLVPLVYFPPDTAYNVPAVLKPATDAAVLKMVYSDGAIRDVRRVGTLQFTLKGQPLELTAYVEVEQQDLEHLFVPFGDKTNGTDTYQAGRLLQLTRTPTGYYELDFNIAFNPSCYFSPQYSCPVPPKENILTVEIRAGEKIKEKH